MSLLCAGPCRWARIRVGADHTFRGRRLIVRVVRGRIGARDVALFREEAGAALSRTREFEGCVFAQIGRQTHADGSEEIIVVTSWSCLDALYKWVGGPDLLNLPPLACIGRLLDNVDIQHYEGFHLRADDGDSAGDSAPGME